MNWHKPLLTVSQKSIIVQNLIYIMSFVNRPVGRSSGYFRSKVQITKARPMKTLDFVAHAPRQAYLIHTNLSMGLMPGGGGGATSICMHIAWVCAARETPIFSPEFLLRSIIIFTNFPQIRSSSSPFIFFFWWILPFRRPPFFLIRSGASPFYIFGADFAVRETVIFRTQNVRQRRGLTAGQSASARRVLAIPESSIFTLKTALARSGDPHFHGPEARFGALAMFYFTATHTYQHLGWVTPPPPPRGGGG